MLGSANWRRISPDRRLVIDLCRIARSLPLYPLERDFQLGALAALRKRAGTRISWSILFMKAYALLAKEEPRLRQSYISWPWPHLYEHPENVAMLAVRRVETGCERLCWGRFVAPDRHSLIELQGQLQQYKDEPVEQIFRRQVRFSRCPAPLRRLGWWLALNCSGTKRAKRVGTFGMSTVAGEGADNRSHPSCLTTSLTYGPLNSAGNMRVTVVFDHSVIDGAPLAEALARLEAILNGPIAQELGRLVPQSQAA